MANLVTWILQAAGEADIQAVIIGPRDYPDYETKLDPLPAHFNRPLTWAEAKSHIDYEFDDGYGTAGCHPIYVYTKRDILFIHEYDGATGLMRIPRRPRKGTVPDYGGERAKKTGV